MTKKPKPSQDKTTPLANPTGSSEPVPKRIGPYRILEKIGEGGMGDVYLAEQEKPVRRRVALKIVKWGMDTGFIPETAFYRWIRHCAISIRSDIQDPYRLSCSIVSITNRIQIW